MDDRLLSALTLTQQFLCPGHSRPIDRAVHLSRLAAFDPACLACPERHDTAGLTSLKLAARAEIERRASSGWQWTTAGLVTSERGELDRELPRQFAFAVADFLWCTEHTRPSVHVGASDSRYASELLAAICHALELAGCDACEVGEVSEPCLAAGVAQAHASGGIWIGNASGQEHELAMRGIGRAGVPWSDPGTLSEVKSRLPAGAVRPRRSGGSLRRFDAAACYLPLFHDTFHGLRPLEFVLHTANASLSAYLNALSAETALRVRCADQSRQLAVFEATGDWLAAELSAVRREVVLSGSHFGLWVDGAAERCMLVDECGQIVAHDRLARLLDGVISATRSEPCPATSAHDDVTHEAIGRQMLTEPAAVASDGRGCYWLPDQAAPDALAVLCTLLSLLSRSDRPLSEVLDAAVRTL